VSDSCLGEDERTKEKREPSTDRSYMLYDAAKVSQLEALQLRLQLQVDLTRVYNTVQ